jgi:hypothetical protein
MPKYYTEDDIIEAWSWAYGEDIDRDYDGFWQTLTTQYGRKMYNRKPSRMQKGGGKRRSGKRKVSDWQKFIKKNSKMRKFKYASGKLNLKKMGVAYRKTRAYKMNRKKKR